MVRYEGCAESKVQKIVKNRKYVVANENKVGTGTLLCGQPSSIASYDDDES